MRIISGKFKGIRLKAPKSNKTRPTSEKIRETVFNICQFSIGGADVLDLFAGTGAIGFEALSRGANRVDFVDSSREAVKAIKENIRKLNVASQTQVFSMNVFQVLKKLKRSYDLIYIDPPYEMFEEEDIQEILNLLQQDKIINPGGMIFLEERKMSPKPNYQLKGFQCIQRVKGDTTLYQFSIALQNENIPERDSLL